MSYETWIGLRYLKSRRRTSFISLITFISILGVTLGVATLSVVLSVMNGFQEKLITKAIGSHAHAVLFRYGINFKDHQRVRKQILAFPGVHSASPIVIGEVMLSAGRKRIGVGLKGIDISNKEHLKNLERYGLSKPAGLLRLRPSAPGELPGIALGKSLADKLLVREGDIVNMITPFSLFGMSYKQRSGHQNFRVTYIFRFGFHQYDSKQCVVEISQAQKLYNLKNSVTGIEILLKDFRQVAPFKVGMMHRLGGWPYRIQDWRDMNRNLFKAIEQNKFALSIVLLFIILVASLNIAGTLILMVLEKSKDIAILRTMGASRQDIMKIFMTYGLYIGALGTLAGVFLGVVLCQIAQRLHIRLDAEIYFISRLPVQLRPLEITVVAVSALIISFLSAIYPAIQAARQKPVDVLRYE
ncbi:MAG: FtsX-like permease family protein [Myxococcales bacterium]|nr:FtsX-like permease family protein [Myxococcales bacterium]